MMLKSARDIHKVMDGKGLAGAGSTNRPYMFSLKIGG
jgi:hypothetical protein